MVEYRADLDAIFHALADPTRRSILERVTKKSYSVGKLAKPYHMSFAAIAKHVSVLEKAKLVSKRRAGKHQIVQATPETIDIAAVYLRKYEAMWKSRFDSLEQLLKKG